MGLEKAVFCRICGQKYFPVSLPFHQRVCIKVFQQTHTDCPLCKRAIFNCEWNDHLAMCKTLPKGKYQPGKSVVQTIQSMNSGLNGIADEQGRHACMVCGRKFTVDRITTHENVCRRRLANEKFKPQQPDPSHSVDPREKKKAQVMTLSDMGRPKSKQVNKMPSLRNKPLPERKQKELKAFAGSGVRLGTYTEQEEEKKAQKTFTGLKKINEKPTVKIDPKWRCPKCYCLNKVEEHKNCQKCKFQRDLTDEEEKQIQKEEQELEKMMAQWGNLELLEDQREDVLDFISEMEIEATPIFICYTLEKLVMIIGNIIKNPTEDKYKTLKMDNQVFYSNIGRFSTGIKFIKYLGFDSIRLENNKLAYKYGINTQKGVPPLLLLSYDELRTALAKNQSSKIGKPQEQLDMSEFPQEEFDRVECAFCLRRFAKDRVDKHQFICQKIKNKPKRKQWNEAKVRLKGTVFENYKPMYRNDFHDRFEICLRRRDISNMQKILDGLKLTQEEYMKKAHELKLDNDWYFRCKMCKEVIHQSVTSKHQCAKDDEEIEYIQT